VVIAAEAIGADASFFVLPYLIIRMRGQKDSTKIVGLAFPPADLTMATGAVPLQKF